MICEKCGKEFFEDYRINEQSRKKPCRFCSIFCAHKRKQTEETKKKISKSLGGSKEIKNCSICGNKLNRNNKNGICILCIHKYKKNNYEYVLEFKRKIKQLSIEYKGGKCEICGYNKYYGALEFHHIDSKEKDFNVSTGTKNFEKLKKELDKCILVCANCHREIHKK